MAEKMTAAFVFVTFRPCRNNNRILYSFFPFFSFFVCFLDLALEIKKNGNGMKKKIQQKASIFTMITLLRSSDGEHTWNVEYRESWTQGRVGVRD